MNPTHTTIAKYAVGAAILIAGVFLMIKSGTAEPQVISSEDELLPGLPVATENPPVLATSTPLATTATSSSSQPEKISSSTTATKPTATIPVATNQASTKATSTVSPTPDPEIGLPKSITSLSTAEFLRLPPRQILKLPPRELIDYLDSRFEKYSESREHFITIRSGPTYSPNNIIIRAGDIITFENVDSDLHWPGADPHPTHSSLPSLDALGGISKDQSYSQTFSKIGIFGYHEHLEGDEVTTVPTMGVVIVLP